MRSCRICVLLCAIWGIALIQPQTLAQEWSAEQKSVLETVSAYWDAYNKGDLQGWLAYMHREYTSWEYDDEIPLDKRSVAKFAEYDLKTYKTLVEETVPITIRVIGPVAIVHEYFTLVVLDPQGKSQEVRGRWTDILLKEGGKWLVVGAHGGNLPQR